MTNFKHTFWTGRGRFGFDVTATLTTRSNAKVGGAVGLIIHDAGIDPQEFRRDHPGASWFAMHKPKHRSLLAACGDCPVGNGGRCYVQSSVQNAMQPAAALRDEEYLPMVRRALFKSKAIRSAVAGDAAALPQGVFDDLVYFVDQQAGGKVDWLGYTHHTDAWWLRETHVASCESLAQSERLEADGWRTFTAVALPSKDWTLDLPDGRFLCPSSNEAGRVRGRPLDCAGCMACSGTDRLRVSKPHPVTIRHSAVDAARRKNVRVMKNGRLVGCGPNVEV